MTINFDYSGADKGLLILSKLQRHGKPSMWDWIGLNKTGGYKTLREHNIINRRGAKQRLLKGYHGDMPGSAVLQGELEILSSSSEEKAHHIVGVLKDWLPQEFSFEHFTISFALYGGEGETTDPIVIDLEYMVSLNNQERDDFLVKQSLILLLKRYQNLERFYLKNFLPIRRYMNFIYTLWSLQVEGILGLINAEERVLSRSFEEENPEGLVSLDNILSKAASADRNELDIMGKEFREQLENSTELGIWLYGFLLKKGGRDAIKQSLSSPLSVFRQLKKGEGDEKILSAEALFFISQIESLLS